MFIGRSRSATLAELMPHNKRLANRRTVMPLYGAALRGRPSSVNGVLTAQNRGCHDEPVQAGNSILTSH